MKTNGKTVPPTARAPRIVLAAAALVFGLWAPGAAPAQTLTVLHTFGDYYYESGGTPAGALLFTSAGTLFGVTRNGGDDATFTASPARRPTEPIRMRPCSSIPQPA